MKKLLVFGLLGASITLLGCKKEEIKPTETTLSETPVFKVEGTVGGEQVSLMAGVDDVYLNTYTLDEHGVNRFCGKLGNTDSYVKLGILDGNIGLPITNPFPNTSIIGFPLAVNEPFIKVMLQGMPNASYISELNFTVDGEDVGDHLNIEEAGEYEICTEVRFYDGTTRTICNTVILGLRDWAPFEVKHFDNVNGNVKAWLDTDQSILAVNWFVDGVQYSSDLLLDVTFTDGQVHTISARATFASGVTREHTILADGNGTARFLNDIYSYKSEIDVLQLRDYTAKLEMKLGDTQYEQVSGTGTNDIIIDGISYFGKNSNGKNVYLVRGTIEAQVRNLQTLQIENANLSITFGLERP